MIYFLLIGYLSVLSIFDIREKLLPTVLLVTGAVAALAYTVLMAAMSVPEFLLGLIPGVLLLLMAFLSREKVGYGDGIMVIIIGTILGWPNTFFVYLISQFLVLGYAVMLLIVKKVKGDVKIPFAPFLAAGLIMYKMGAFL